MRAKFICNKVESYEDSEIACLNAVTDGSVEEDRRFHEATPYGELEIQIDNPNAMGFFEPGKDYYLDFTEAPE